MAVALGVGIKSSGNSLRPACCLDLLVLKPGRKLVVIRVRPGILLKHMAPIEGQRPEWCLVDSYGQAPISFKVKSADTGEDLGCATLTLNLGGTFWLDLAD